MGGIGVAGLARGVAGLARGIACGAGFAGEEFAVTLFVLIPLMPLIKDRNKADDEEEGDKKDPGVEVLAIGFHVGPFIPAGGEIDHNRYNK